MFCNADHPRTHHRFARQVTQSGRKPVMLVPEHTWSEHAEMHVLGLKCRKRGVECIF